MSWILIGKSKHKVSSLRLIQFQLNLLFFTGNKCDFESLREVEQTEALAMAELVPEIVLVMETSAKDNTNVEQSFVELATELKVWTFFFQVCYIINQFF